MRKPPLHPVDPIGNLRDLLFKSCNSYSDRIALKSKKGGVYHSLTYEQLWCQVIEMATAYARLDLRPGDQVAVLSENRTEWVVAYLAAVTTGLVVVPIDKDLTPQEMVRVLKYSKAKTLICSQEYVNRLNRYRGELEALERWISMEDQTEGVDQSFRQALQMGREARKKGDRSFEGAVVAADDLAAVIFTSGTTGKPKGVMLTHGNIASNTTAISQCVSIRGAVALSVLPLHHTYECTAGLLVALHQGCTICHAESLRRIADNLRETKATVMLGVPLLFESFYRRLESTIQERGGRRFKLAKLIADVLEQVFRLNLRRRIFKQIHENLGGHLELLISGGAAINPAVSRGFRELGIHFIQGYGLTETSPIIAVNRVNCFKDSAVGLPLPGLEVKIMGGEIVVRGPSVMKGYYQNEDATKETVKDGWLHTGDLGHFDDDGFLHISGRVKSVIVTPNGKNVYPEEIEGLLNQSPYILESLVWGGSEKDPARVKVQAIIVADREAFEKEFGPGQYDDEKIDGIIGEEIKKYCRDIATYKRVKQFETREQEFEKTTTRKIKRYLYTGKPQDTDSHGSFRSDVVV